MLDISVVIVNWNTEDLIADAISSLYKETKNHAMEIIFVDNASTDNSVKLVKKRFPKVKVIVNKKNLGFAKANNVGIRQARGRYITLINTDTKALDRVLDRMLDYLDRNPRVGALMPLLVDNDLRPREFLQEFPSLRNIVCEAFYLNKLFPKITFLRGRALPSLAYGKTRTVDTVPCNYMVVRREALDSVGLLDEDFFIFAEDIDWCMRLHKAQWDIVYYPEAKAIHYGGSSSGMVPVRSLLEKINSELLFWKKHRGKLRQLAYRLLLIMHYANRIGMYVLLYIGKPASRSIISGKLQAFRASIKFLITGKGPRIKPQEA